MQTEQINGDFSQWAVQEQRLHTPLFDFIEPNELQLPQIIDGQLEPPKTTAIALLNQATETD